MTPEPQIIVLPLEDEWPHAPGTDHDWQESVVLTFQDQASRTGGFIRIGHHPNRETGNCTFGVVSPDMGFNRTRQDVPMRPGDRSDHGFAIDGFLTAAFEQGASRWRAATPDCDLDLEMMDFLPLYDTWALSGLTGGFRDKFAASHTENAGRVRGRLRLADREWLIDGFGYRDHSWGVRHMDDPETALTHLLWLVGSFGEDFVFALVEVIARTGKRTKMGYIVKDGVFDIPRLVDLALEVEFDGLCTRGARCRFETQKLGTFDFAVTTFGNIALGMERRYLEFGAPAKVVCGDRTGGAHLSTMFNARHGTARPTLLFGSSLGNGLYARARFGDAAAPSHPA